MLKSSGILLYYLVRVKGWIHLTIRLTCSLIHRSRSHGEAQIFKVYFQGAKGRAGLGKPLHFKGNRQVSLVLPPAPGHSPLTSGCLLRAVCLWPIQQVHLRGLLRGHTTPGPALVPMVVEGRGIFQLTGEVKAAFQTCNDKEGQRMSWFPNMGPALQEARVPPRSPLPLLHLIHSLCLSGRGKVQFLQ